jgi:pimeloyl-ACP methyl ester carboxylesterase
VQGYPVAVGTAIALLGAYALALRSSRLLLRRYFLHIAWLALAAAASLWAAYSGWLGGAPWLAAVAWLLAGCGLAGLAVAKLLFAPDTRYERPGRLFRSLTKGGEAIRADFALPGPAPVAPAPDERPWRRDEAFEVRTADGVTIRGRHTRAGHRSVVILAHGTGRGKDTACYLFLARWLAYKHDVIAFDFRGHGDSDGSFDFSDKAVEDLKAVVDYARRSGEYDAVGVVGRSLGAWIALLEAARYRDVDTIVAAAAPLGQITAIDTAQLYRRWLEVPAGRLLLLPLARWLVTALRGIRVSGFAEAQRCPIEVVGELETLPVFFIYQEWDWVIKTDVEDALTIFAAKPGPKDLLVLAGDGHIFEVHQFQRVYAAIEAWLDETLVPTAGVEPARTVRAPAP